jgi:membrane-associated protein
VFNSVLEFLGHLTNEHYILHWGSVLIMSAIVFAECSFLIGVFMPGNALIFVAGAACAFQPGLLGVSLPMLIFILCFGAWFGYFIGYWWGYKKLGPAWLKKDTRVFFFKKKYVDGTIRFYDDHGGKTLIIARFLPVARTFAPIIAGMIQMNYRKYVLYNVVGAILWCSSLACAGYFFGDNEWVQDNYGVAIIALIIIAIASILTRARVFSRR